MKLPSPDQVLGNKNTLPSPSDILGTVKKKVASKPRSQEELWGSDSQPQDLYTSLVTDAQEPQQESDGLGGPPSPPVKKKPSVLFPETPMGRPAASVMYEAKQPTLVESTPFEEKPKKYYRIVSDEKKAVEQQISDLEQRNARLGRTPESLTTEGTYQALQKQKAQLDQEFEPAQTAIKEIKKDTSLFGRMAEPISMGVTGGRYSFIDTETIKLNKEVEDKLIDKFDSVPEETKVKWYKGGLHRDEKEQLINSAKTEVITDKYNVLKQDADNYIKNIKDNPNISDEEKLKFQKDFKERQDDFNSQLAIDYSGKLLKNNFKRTKSEENMDEAILGKYKGFIPETLDILSTLAEGAGQVIAKSATAIPSLILMGAEQFNQLTGISRPEDYTSIEATMDLINDVTNFNFLPSSQTKKGKIYTKEGDPNFSYYSVGKTLANTLPFTFKIINDVKKGRIEGTPQSMISQLINPKYNKEFADKLRVAESAYKITIGDNYREAKDLGMDDSKAFIYANTMSLAEGLSENIMPDFKYFDSVAGSSIKAAFKGNLKKAVTKQAAKTVTKEFFKDIASEIGEEEFTAAVQDGLKYSLLLNHQNSEFFNLNKQKELVASTVIMSGALGAVSANEKFKENKKDIYNEIHKNIYELQNSFLDEINSPLNDQKAKESLAVAYKYANDVSAAISNAPENVTADQIDLLVQKKNLEEKKKNIDTAFHPDINEEIAGIDAKIRELAKMPAAVEEVAVEEVAPAVEEVKPAEVAVKPSGQKVTDIINRPATLESQAGVRLETPIEGDVYQEGQRVIFEDKNKKTYDLGNIDEVSDKTVEELGIKPQEEMVSLTPEGKIKVGGNEWNMQSELPNYGIEYDKDGNVKAVSLKDEAGKTIMYEGQVAEDAAYQVLLKQTETPEQRQAINEILENDEELNRQLREAEEATQAAAAEVTEPGAPKTQAEQYSEELDQTKADNPEDYWSVSPVSAADAAKGTIIDTPDGAAIVKPDGDIAGLFKKATSNAKGVAQDLLKRAVAAGGKKLDNFDTYLTPQYIKAGFRVVSRTPFNEEYAPPGWNKEKHGTPDVVAMIYDPEGKLDIEEKTFDNPDTGYDEAIAYRDSLLEPSIDAELEGLTKLFDESDKGFRMSQVDNAKEALKGILPGVKFIVHETNEAYNKAVGDSSSGAYIMYANGDRIIHINKKNANGRTVAHEVFHAVILDKIKGDKKVQEITARMVDAVYKTASPELRAELDAFAARYSDETIRDEERLAELIGIIADGYPQMSPANKSIVKRWLDALAKTFGLKPFTDNEVIDLLNTLAGKVSTGEVISEADVDILNNINELNSKSEGSSGDQMNAAIIDRKQIKDSLDNSFKLIEYDDTNLPDNIKMPNRSTVESVIDKSGGAAIFINSDGTKVGIRKNNTPLHGGWRYTYLVENQKDNIGFAATSSTHVKNMHGLAVKLADVRDSENEKAKGKPIAVFVTIQNADTMLGEWYAGEFFMEGIDKAINNNAFKGGVNTAKKLLIDAITYKSQIENLKKKIKEKKESLLTAKDKDKINSQIDKLKDQVKNKLEVSKKADNNRFINLINSENFNTHDGRIKIAKELSSKKFSFGYRVKLLKQLIPLKSATGSNKEIKKALLDVNNGRVDFYNEHLDEVLLNKMKETNYDETSIGGVSLGGFFMDPYMSFDKFYNNRKNGIKHAQFNESFTSNGDTFSLDSVINVNKLSPEMGYPTNKGYELYNSSNKTNFTKKNTTLNDRFKIANFLYKETNNNSKYLTPPFTSIGGSMYTSTVFDQKTAEEKTIIRKQIVGENANLSQNVRDNLDIARDMESSKKSDKEIRLATGWERGTDNKWRYEVPDNIPFLKDTVKTVGEFLSEDKDTNQLSQKANYFLPKELLDLYPQLNDITIKFDKVGDESEASYDPTKKTIEASIGVYPTKTVSALIHEVQHAIQEIEGFAEGGSLATSAKLAILSLEKKLGKRIESTTRKEMVSLKLNKKEENFRTFILNSFYKAKNQKQLLNLIDKEAYSVYKKLAGEVESRNVERRMNATPEARIKNTLQETEDVAREDQIIFFKRSQLQEEGVNTVSESFFNDADKIFPNDHILGGYAVTDSKGKLIGRVKLSEVDDNTVKIDEVVSEKKGERTGNGSAIMKMVIDNADKNNTRLTLTANLILGIKAKGFETAKKLQSFYEKFGFIKGANGLMTREPVISKRLQQAKTIDEMVSIARQSNYSDAAITAFLKAKGFSDAQIANALSTDRPSVNKIYEDSKKAIEDKKKRTSIKDLAPFLRKSILDRQTYIKKVINRIDNKSAKKAYDLLVTKAGASALAAERFKRAEKKIYGGLNADDTSTLDKIIYAKRMVSVNESRAKLGLEPYKGMDGYSIDDANKDLADFKNSLGDKKFNDLSNRATEYFDVFKLNLKKLYESGRISKETYESLKDTEYSPIKTIKYIIGDNLSVDEIDTQAKSLGISRNDIMKLSDSNENEIIMDSKWLLAMSINSVEGRAFENNMLREFDKAIKNATPEEKKAFEDIILDNPVVGTKKDGGLKYKYDDTRLPVGFAKVSYFNDGNKVEMILKDQYAKQLLDVKDKNKALETLGKLTGTKILRFFATGGNPLFIIGNTAVDFQNIAFFSDVYSKFKPVATVQLARDYTKNFVKKLVTSNEYNTIFNEYLNHGGALDYMASDGLRSLESMNPVKGVTKAVQKGLIAYGRAMSLLGETSEVAFRLSVFQKVKEDSIKEFKKENNREPNEQELDDIMWDAARQSRETMPFDQGGDIAKKVDAVFPYFNAALQGIRRPIDFAKRDPVGFSSSVLQYTVMASSLAAASFAMLISAVGGDDDEEKAKKIMEAMNSLSEYEKANYHIMFTGEKNKDGEYKYYRIKKLPVLSVISTVAEQLIYKAFFKSKGIEYDMDSKVMLEAVSKSNPLPVTVMEVAAKNPIASGLISYAFNTDTFTGDKIFREPDNKKILPEAEGMFDDRVDQIYKDLAPGFGLSPARTKVMVEKVITSANTNPTIPLIYSAYDGLFNKNDGLGSEVKEAMSNVSDAFGKKVVRYTDKKIIRYKDQDEREYQESLIETKVWNSEQKVYNEIKKKYDGGGSLTNKELIDLVKENFEPMDYMKYAKKYNTYIHNMNIDKSVLDIIFEDVPEVQAMKLNQRYGPNLESEELKELGKAMNSAGKRVNNKSIYIYNKKYKNRKNAQ